MEVYSTRLTCLMQRKASSRNLPSHLMDAPNAPAERSSQHQENHLLSAAIPPPVGARQHAPTDQEDGRANSASQPRQQTSEGYVRSHLNVQTFKSHNDSHSSDFVKLTKLMEEQITILRRIDQRQAAAGMFKLECSTHDVDRL